MKGREKRLNVADVIISLTTEPDAQVYGYVHSFLVSDPAEATVNIRFSQDADLAEQDRQLPAVAEHPTWKAFRTLDGKSMIIERIGGRVQARFATEPHCKIVDVLVCPPEEAEPDTDEGSAGERSLIELLPVPVVVLLSSRHGLFLHSCAVNLAGNGILFSGVSGSGKSTMAELWRRFTPANSHVIDDEHILARLDRGTTWLYGAPWSRGPYEATYSRTPLKAVFFISHGTQNRCIRMSRREALAELMSQVFLPAWSREQLQLTTRTCAEILEQVHCYRLPFVPNREVISFVQDVLEHPK